MSRRPTRVALVAMVGVWLAITAGVAFARPGGGDSYSGGGGHGGGGGGGGGGDIGFIFELIYWTLRLVIEAPAIGLPILGGIVIWVAYSAYKQHANKDWDSGPPAVERRIEPDALRSIDPDFSQVVFEDFAFRLFSTAHRARSAPDGLASVAPYVSPAARSALAAMPPANAAIRQVIVGAMRVVRVEIPSDRTSENSRVRVGLEFEANIMTADKTYFTVESWLLSRAANVRSKPPAASRTFPCPNCGAPWQSTQTGSQTCASCGQVVDNGRFDWLVDQVSLVSIDERPPTLTTEVPERGTDLPTYIHRHLEHTYKRLQADDPTVDQHRLNARLTLIHSELAVAWSNNDLTPVRGLVSDGLYDYLDYWVQAYKQQGLRNHMLDGRITRSELAKVVRDRWYDAITMRIWATGRDFVVKDSTGKVVRGSKHRERPYSEYWTLIRSSQRRGEAPPGKTCGNCGAPLDVTMAGACSHCGSHVTAGEFDWVLSKIEQDDSYRG